MTLTLKTISVLSEAESGLAIQIEQYLKNKKFSGRLIYKTQLSTFIDPGWITEEQNRDCLFQGVILFSLVKGHKNSNLELAIIDKNERCASQIATILSEYSFDSYVHDSRSGTSGIFSFLDNHFSNTYPSNQSKKITNPGERWLLSITDYSLGRRIQDDIRKIIPPNLQPDFEEFRLNAHTKYRTFHEVALKAFIDIFDLDANTTVRKYALASRVDLLVTGNAPNFQPLMVIEYDGHDHQKPRVKEKDRKKELICNAARVPLLRVRIEDAPELGKKISPITKKLDEKPKENILLALIGDLLRNVHRKKIKEPEEYWKEFLAIFSEEMNARKKDKEALTLSSDEAKQIYLECLEKTSLDRLEKSCEFHVEDELQEFEWKSIGIPFGYPNIKTNNIDIDEFQFCGNVDSGRYCTCSVHHGNNLIWFTSPSVHLVGYGFEEFNVDFQYIVDQLLKQSVLTEINDHLKTI